SSCAITSCAVLASGSPERFALVTGRPPPLAAMRRRASGWSGTRNAIVPRRGATRTMVSGPGQKRWARARAMGVTIALASRFPMSKSSTLLIDKGGVLIDNTVLSPQYRRLLGEFLPTELGGDPKAWEDGNVGAASRAFERYRDAHVTALSTSISDWYTGDVRQWLYEMCDEVGRTRPPQAQADRIANAAHDYVRRRVDIRA